ncbi:MAG: tRNA preQ1(34) S-adenosylmethionine ribosyltransferase-isomerase QueA [Fimbriimonas sp.]
MDRLSDYDYHLPEELIAQTPLADRADSRLLRLDRATGAVHHHQFRDILELLHPGDLLVMNDTRVSARRLLGSKTTGGAVECLLLNEVEPGVFDCLLRPAKRLPPGTRIDFEQGAWATVLDYARGEVRRVQLEHTGPICSLGVTPLPPYIHEVLSEEERYQTVYGQNAGSAAAPTAGLHFTTELLEALEKRGVGTARVTMHVGIDTFRPVQVEDLSQHVMHGEVCEVPEATSDAIRDCRGRVIAVGTTTVRTLETMAVGRRTVEPGQRVSTLFIRPGYDFKVIDGMFTNFHLPKTTMLAMISALAGQCFVLSAYEEAIRYHYRFLSFGDSMLIL